MYGFRFQEAKIYKSWVRFEASVKHNYAHQITEQLLEKDDNSNYIIQKEMELQGLIAKRIVDRYCFYDMALDEAATFSEDLAEIASGAQVGTLSRPNPRDKLIPAFFQLSLRFMQFGEMRESGSSWSFLKNIMKSLNGKNPIKNQIFK